MPANWPDFELPEHRPLNDLAQLGLDPLPPKCQPKIDALIDRRDDAHAAYRSASDTMMEARHNFGLISNRRRYAEIDAPNQKLRPEDAERLDAEVASAKAGLDKAKARVDAASERTSSFAFLDRSLQWLADARAARQRLKPAAAPAPKGKDFRQEVDRLRTEIAAVDDAWTATATAPRPTKAAIDVLHEEIDAVAARGAPRFDMRRRSGPPLAFADQFYIRLRQSNPDSGYGLQAHGGGAEFLVWMMRDEIKARLGAMIDQADVVGALTDEEQEQRFRELSARRLGLERLEEATIVAAEAEGMFITRRDDADPRAILEVAEA
ncbi:hypothetical protein PZ895_11390 [Mesorhizobium sp. YIM 152430]|uniref:hypothetical protein n=1 Tax=Mesorhizobium sp. YIM 152430 TaxID=3031761 RepID=UPI0023D9BE9E|nr:hypothetical protein [Mesorhizobium sp. YIM 152430]MDF1600363.1 hypothetical protein [Mesorhizobium sp. YIM 152430]